MSSSLPPPNHHDNPHLLSPLDFVTPVSAKTSVSSISLDILHGSTTSSAPAAADEKAGVHGDRIDSDDTYISFRPVERVTVKVKDLGIEVTESKGLRKRRITINEKTLDEEKGKNQGVRILQNVNVDFPSGELVGIIGSSGSGKVCFPAGPTSEFRY